VAAIILDSSHNDATTAHELMFALDRDRYESGIFQITHNTSTDPPSWQGRWGGYVSNEPSAFSVRLAADGPYFYVRGQRFTDPVRARQKALLIRDQAFWPRTPQQPHPGFRPHVACHARVLNVSSSAQRARGKRKKYCRQLKNRS